MGYFSHVPQEPLALARAVGHEPQALPNPHLIFPGQTLYLDKSDGYARLRTQPTGGSDTVRLSPRTRTDSLASLALPTLKTHLIAPFLVEPLVADAATIEQAPRLVATTDQRVLMAAGDRVYARGNPDAPLSTKPGQPAASASSGKPFPERTPLPGRCWVMKPVTWATPNRAQRNHGRNQRRQGRPQARARARHGGHHIHQGRNSRR